MQEYKKHLNSLTVKSLKELIKKYMNHVKIIVSKKTKNQLIEHIMEHTELKNNMIVLKNTEFNLPQPKKAPKGQHFMPDGTLMKDSEHKQTEPKKKPKPDNKKEEKDIFNSYKLGEVVVYMFRLYLIIKKTKNSLRLSELRYRKVLLKFDDTNTEELRQQIYVVDQDLTDRRSIPIFKSDIKNLRKLKKEETKIGNARKLISMESKTITVSSSKFKEGYGGDWTIFTDDIESNEETIKKILANS